MLPANRRRGRAMATPIRRFFRRHLREFVLDLGLSVRRAAASRPYLHRFGPWRWRLRQRKGTTLRGSSRLGHPLMLARAIRLIRLMVMTLGCFPHYSCFAAGNTRPDAAPWLSWISRSEVEPARCLWLSAGRRSCAGPRRRFRSKQHSSAHRPARLQNGRAAHPEIS